MQNPTPKQKLIAMIIAGFAAIAPMSVLQAQHPALGGGNGTSGSPYQIASEAHLYRLH